MKVGRWILVGLVAGSFWAGSALGQDACTPDDQDALFACVDDALASCSEAFPGCFEGDEPGDGADFSEATDAIESKCFKLGGKACKKCLRGILQDLRTGELRSIGPVLPFFDDLESLIEDLALQCPASGGKNGKGRDDRDNRPGDDEDRPRGERPRGDAPRDGGPGDDEGDDSDDPFDDFPGDDEGDDGDLADLF